MMLLIGTFGAKTPIILSGTLTKPFCSLKLHPHANPPTCSLVLRDLQMAYRLSLPEHTSSPLIMHR